MKASMSIESSGVPPTGAPQIVRMPGGTTALMPFYGTTPAEAAGLLSGWLTRAAGATT